jgi:hypothetical protein
MDFEEENGMKNPAFRKVFYALSSVNYKPDKDLLYLEAFAEPDWYDLELSIGKHGYLDTHETYRAYYNSNKDVRQFREYFEKKQRDMEWI